MSTRTARCVHGLRWYRVCDDCVQARCLRGEYVVWEGDRIEWRPQLPTVTPDEFPWILSYVAQTACRVRA